MRQALDLALDIFGLPAAAALVVSLALAWTARQLTPPRWSGHYIVPCAVAIGFVIGYALLPRDWAAWKPDASQPWTSLPYLGLMAAIFAAAFPPAPRSQAWKFVLVAVGPIAAVYLTPNWPVFGLTREKVRWILLAYLLLVGVPLQYLPARLANHALLAILAVAATMTAVVTGAMVSIRFAQLAATAAGALAGSWIATLLSPKPGLPGKSVIPVYTVLVGGIAWIACVEPDPPQTGLLAIPLIPLALWLIPLVSRLMSGATARPGKPSRSESNCI
jgi:hypothetical protein